MSVGVCKLVMICVFIFSGISKPNVPQWREAAALCSHPFIEFRLKQKCISAKFPFHTSLSQSRRWRTQKRLVSTLSSGGRKHRQWEIWPVEGCDSLGSVHFVTLRLCRSILLSATLHWCDISLRRGLEMQLLKLRGLTFGPREILDALPVRDCHSDSFPKLSSAASVSL